MIYKYCVLTTKKQYQCKDHKNIVFIVGLLRISVILVHAILSLWGNSNTTGTEGKVE